MSTLTGADAALLVLIAPASHEFSAYRAIVESVSDAVARNDEQLATVAAARTQHVALVGETRTATGEATAGAGGVADAAAALAGIAVANGRAVHHQGADFGADGP